MSRPNCRFRLCLPQLLALLLAAALFPGCSEDSASPADSGEAPVIVVVDPTGGTISSADGRLILTIPDGALVQTTSISITKLTGGELPNSLFAEGAELAYRVEPEALDFLKPATLSYRIPAPSNIKTDGLPADIPTLLAVLRESGGDPVVLDSQEMLLDGDSHTEQVTLQAYGTAVYGILEKVAVSAGLDGIPSPVPCGGPFAPVLFVNRHEGSQFEGTATFEDRCALVSGNLLSYSGEVEKGLGQLDAATPEIMSSLQSYTCTCNADAAGTLAAAVVFSDYRLSETLSGTGTYTVFFKLSIDCAGGGGDTSEVGVADAPVTAPEGLFRVRPAFAGLLAAVFMVVLAGTNGWAVLDPHDGTALLNAFLLANLASYGALPLSHTSSQKQAGYVDAFFAFGPNDARITQYDAATEQWGQLQYAAYNSNVTDAVSYGNKTISEGLVYVNFSYNQVGFKNYDPVNDGFTAGSPALLESEFPAPLPGHLVSAFSNAIDAPVLVVADGTPGKLYLHPHDGSGSASLVGEVGDGPRRVRAAAQIAVVSNFESDDLTIVLWDGGTTASVVRNVLVGDGPIGIDLLDLGDGTVAVCSTGYNDNTYTVTLIDSDGSVLSNITTSAPGGCQGPGHAIWARDGTRNLLFSCNGSDQIVTAASGL